MKKYSVKDLKVELEKLPLDETEKKSDTQPKDGKNVTKQSQKSGNKKVSSKCQNESQKDTQIVVESPQNLLYISLVKDGNYITKQSQKTGNKEVSIKCQNKHQKDTQIVTESPQNLLHINLVNIGRHKDCVPKKTDRRNNENKVSLNISTAHVTCMGCQKYNKNVDTDVNKENKVSKTVTNNTANLIIPLKECLHGNRLKSFQIRLDKYFNNNIEVSKNISTKNKEMSTENCDSKTSKSSVESLEIEIEPKKGLRHRTKQNYAETTINISEVKESTDIPKQLPERKIPVYKQIIEEKKTAESDDLYDFNEPDLEKTDKKRKRKYNVNRSKKSDRTMYEILQKIEAKEAKLKNKNTKKKTRKKVEEKSEHKKYGEVIETVLKNILEKVNSRNKSGGENSSTNVKCPKIITLNDKEINLSLIQSEPDVNITKNHPQQLKSDIDKTQEKSQKVVSGMKNSITILRSDLSKTRSRGRSDNIFSSTKIIINDSDLVDNFYGFSTDKDERSEKIMRVIEDFSRRSGIALSKWKNNEVSDDIFSAEETSDENIGNEHSDSEDEFYGFCIDKDERSEKIMHVIEDFSRRSGIDISKPKNNEVSDDIFSAEEPSDEIIANEDSDSEDAFSGFCTENASTPLKPKRINVISNVLINSEDKESPYVLEDPEDRESPDLFFNLESDVNNIPKVKYTPWRFNKYCKRNPHFIALKNTALPCLKQDMVLEYNELKKIIIKFPQVETPKKTPASDLFESDNQENIHPRSSLFDYESFSPEKNENNERNVLGKKTKRNILMPTIDNYFNIQPKKVENENLAHRVIRNYSESIRRKKLVSEQSDLIEKHTKKDKEVDEQKNDEEMEKVAEEIVDVHDDSDDIRLFEDPETEEKAFSLNVPSKIYERKKRRKRAKSVDSENGAASAKKNPKNCMTKEEEAELEKWAANFNSVCAEIDKYELEIE